MEWLWVGGVGEAWVRRSEPSVLDEATASRPSIVTNGHQLGEIHRATFWFGPSLVPVQTRVGENSCSGAERFAVCSHPVGPWTGRCAVARFSLYLLMGIDTVKMVARR